MAAVRTTLVKRKAYSNDMPWQLQAAPPGITALRARDSRSVDMRLVRYLTTTTARSNERTHAAYEAGRRQSRFFFLAAVLAAVWALFLFI